MYQWISLIVQNTCAYSREWQGMGQEEQEALLQKYTEHYFYHGQVPPGSEGELLAP